MKDHRNGSHVVNAEPPMWRIVGSKELAEERSSTMEFEDDVEDLVVSEPSCLGKPLLIIGWQRQRSITENGGIDMLALDAAATTVLIEFKVDKADRKAMSQVNEYWAWATTLDTDQILAAFERYRPGRDLAEAFLERFGHPLPPVLHLSHEVIIVAATVDSKTELSIRALHQWGLPINLFRYRYYRGLPAIQFLPLIEADQDRYVDREFGASSRGRLVSAGEVARLHASLDRFDTRLEEFRPILEALRRPPAAATTSHPIADMSGIDQHIMLFWLTHARSLAWDFVPFRFLYELYLHWLRTQAAAGLELEVLDHPIFAKRLAKAATATGEWIHLPHRPDNLMDAPEPLMKLVPDWKRPEGNPLVHGYLRNGTKG